MNATIFKFSYHLFVCIFAPQKTVPTPQLSYLVTEITLNNCGPNSLQEERIVPNVNTVTSRRTSRLQ